jgi:hypothetical protein
MSGSYYSARFRTGKRFRRLLATVLFRMQLGRFGSMMISVVVMPVSSVGVMSSLLVIARLMMLGGLSVVLCRPLVMLGCLQMVLGCLFRHVGILSQVTFSSSKQWDYTAGFRDPH